MILLDDQATWPKLNSRWRHYNGLEYEILAFANVSSTSPTYPATVVYFNVHTGSFYTRPLSEWNRSFVPAPA